MVGRNHPKSGHKIAGLAGLATGFFADALEGRFPRAGALNVVCVLKAAEIWGNQQVGSNEYMIQLYNYIQLHMVLFLWEYVLNNFICVFFEGKTTVPTPPWGTRRWTMVGMTGWFVDLNWDVRWCNHRQWFLIWIYQTMNLAFSTIWFQHRLNNDISNVSYVQMMFFPSPFRWSRNGLVRLWMHFGVLRTNVRGVRLLVRWTKHGQRVWVLGSDMYIEGLGEWWIINDLVSSWEAIFCWAWWHEEICLEEFYRILCLMISGPFGGDRS